MSDLISIPGIGNSSLELLEAAGFHDIESLAKANAGSLANELERANSVLNLAKRAPSLPTIGKWIDAARERVGAPDIGAAATTTAMPVDYEKVPEVASMLSVAPFALPLPARVMMENQLAVSDIPPGILLNRYSGDLEVRTEERVPQQRQRVQRQPQQRQTKPESSSSYVQLAETGNERRQFDTSKIRSIDDMAEPLVRLPAIKTAPSNDRLALLRAPRSTTNKGRSPESRWYIRGVLHSHPVSVYIGALVTLLLIVAVPTAVVTAALLFISGEQPEYFEWVPGWLLVFPLILPVLGIAYLFWGITSSCRICGIKLFTHRGHLKNIKAHHVRGLGYIVPLCFQILIFRWFRCTHCGTPVRLKE